MVVIRIDQNEERVIEAVERIPPGQAGTDELGMVVVKASADVKCFVIIKDPNFGVLRGGIAVARHVAAEAGLRGGELPHRLIEAAIDPRSRGDEYRGDRSRN